MCARQGGQLGTWFSALLIDLQTLSSSAVDLFGSSGYSVLYVGEGGRGFDFSLQLETWPMRYLNAVGPIGSPLIGFIVCGVFGLAFTI